MAVVEFAERHTQEWIRAAGAELNARDRLLLGRIDDEVFRIRLKNSTEWWNKSRQMAYVNGWRLRGGRICFAISVARQ
jgi:hypothetical protein